MSKITKTKNGTKLRLSQFKLHILMGLVVFVILLPMNIYLFSYSSLDDSNLLTLSNVRGGRRLEVKQKEGDTPMPYPKNRTVVVYTGPTDMNPEDGKSWLYQANFNYFLEHGIQCERGQDTIIVLSKEVTELYRSRLEEVILHCRKVSPYPKPVRVFVRKNRCCFEDEKQKTDRDQRERRNNNTVNCFLAD